MDEPQKRYAKWKKSNTKDHIHNCIYMKCPKKGQSVETKSR